MKPPKTFQEIMSEFYATSPYPKGAGANWRDLPPPDKDGGDVTDMDELIEEMFGEHIRLMFGPVDALAEVEQDEAEQAMAGRVTTHAP